MEASGLFVLLVAINFPLYVLEQLQTFAFDFVVDCVGETIPRVSS
jgi:hypothetical protein